MHLDPMCSQSMIMICVIGWMEPNSTFDCTTTRHDGEAAHGTDGGGRGILR